MEAHLNASLTSTLKPLRQPEILVCSVLLLAAFGFGMFFGGYRDLTYAPASFALLAFACTAIIPSFWRGLAFPAAPAAGFAFALWLYVTISLSWSTVPFASLVTYLIFIALPLGFFGLLLSARREDMTKGAGLTLWAGIGVAACWAVIQYIFLRDVYGPRAHHPLPNPNNLAGLINLGLLPALALCFKPSPTLPPSYARSSEAAWAFWRTRLRRFAPKMGGGMRRVWRLRLTRSWVGGNIAALALYALFFAALVATESRGAMLAFLAGGCITLFILRGAVPDFRKRAALIVSVSAAVFVLLGLAGGSHFAGRLGALADVSHDGSAMARLAIWKNAWAMVKDHPWLGTGFGTFYLYYPAYLQPGGADDSIGHWAHMDPLQYWAEMGIAAPLLFYGLCLAVLVRTVYAVRALPKDAPERMVIAGLACGLLAVVLHAHLTFNLYIIPILVVSGVWLAGWYIATGRALGNPALRVVDMEKEWQKPFLALITVAIAGLIGVMAASSAAGQYYLLRAQDRIRHGLPAQFTAEIDRAEQWAPHSFIDPEVQLAALYIDLLGENAAALFEKSEQQALYLQAKALLENAEQQNPAWAEIDYKRGRLYSVIDTGYEPQAREKAIAALREAIRKNKRHFEARYQLAQLYIKSGRVEPAYAVLEEGLTYRHAAAVEKAYRPVMERLERLIKLKRAYEESKAEKAGKAP